MLFNSYAFIFGFLPVVFVGFYLLGKYSHSLASLWIAAASLFFYGWWDSRFVGLLLGSIVFNYSTAYLIGHKVVKRGAPGQGGSAAWWLLACSIACNLALLGYFKYANFFAENLNHFFGTSLRIGEIILPLGISFFSFTQIAFLVDTYQGKVKEYNFVHYAMFVTYFPHLIAGPILHHKEMMPQFARRESCKINWDNVAVGLAIFVLGLAKKILLADSLAGFASPVFDAAKSGAHPMLFEAWTGALAYTLQLYFDFSGYSDMAIGLSLMFNVRLPMNFNSPYKSRSIVEFWRRWHMTLSRFLRDYLYISLGGNRRGKAFRYVNLSLTMLLGGLWHGAGWTFVIWGGLHGFYLMVNHAWRAYKQGFGWGDGGAGARFASCLLTFMVVVVGWVFFKAENVYSAIQVLDGMLGLNGVSFDESFAITRLGQAMSVHGIKFIGALPLMSKYFLDAMRFVVPGLLIVFLLPNTSELLKKFRPALDHEHEEPLEEVGSGLDIQRRLQRLLEWNPTWLQGLLYGMLFFLLLSYMASASKSEFLYFQF